MGMGMGMGEEEGGEGGGRGWEWGKRRGGGEIEKGKREEEKGSTEGIGRISFIKGPRKAMTRGTEENLTRRGVKIGERVQIMGCDFRFRLQIDIRADNAVVRNKAAGLNVRV